MTRSISVTMSMTLDGVVQGLGRADEDTRGGFAHGGWGPQHNDDVMAQEMGKGPAPLTEFDLTGSVMTTKGVITAHYSRR